MITCESLAQAQSTPGVTLCHFNGEKWIAYQAGDALPTPSTASVQDQMWVAIKAERDRRTLNGGYSVVVNGVAKWFHSDLTSRSQQIGLVLLGSNIAANLQWKTMDGSFVPMTQALAGQIFAAAAAQDQANFAAAETHRANVLASADPASYDFSGGWPTIYGA